VEVFLGLLFLLLAVIMGYFACRPMRPLDIQRSLFGIDQRRVIEDEDKYRGTSAARYGLAAAILVIAALALLVAPCVREQRQQDRRRMRETMRRSRDEARREQDRLMEEKVKDLYPHRRKKAPGTDTKRK